MRKIHVDLCRFNETLENANYFDGNATTDFNRIQVQLIGSPLIIKGKAELYLDDFFLHKFKLNNGKKLEELHHITVVFHDIEGLTTSYSNNTQLSSSPHVIIPNDNFGFTDQGSEHTAHC